MKAQRKRNSDSESEFIGPVLPQKVILSHKEMGTQLLPGEGNLYNGGDPGAATQYTKIYNI